MNKKLKELLDEIDETELDYTSEIRKKFILFLKSEFESNNDNFQGGEGGEI